MVHLIASLLSVCEFRTFREGTELHGEEWAALNVRPNRNQNAPAWKRELIARLLLSGETLCIRLSDGQLIIAESFNRTEYADRGDEFTQVSRAGITFSRSYNADDVLFLQSPANARAAWVQQIMREYEKLMQSASGRFQKADGERGILKVSAVARGDKDFETTFNRLMNDYFKGYFGSKNAVLPLFDGYDYTAKSGGSSGTYTNDLTAVKTLADEAISRAAQLFGIPPSYVRGDAAGIRDAQSAAMTNCIKPLAAMLSAELTAWKNDVATSELALVSVDSALKNVTVTASETTYVKFAPLSEQIIENYTASGECDDKAGAYGIQDTAALWIEGIRGDYFNVVGLPLHRLESLLQESFSLSLQDFKEEK